MAELRTTGEERAKLRTYNEITFAHPLIDDIETLLAENQRLRDCLAWYADEAQYQEKTFWVVDAPVRWSLIERDEGQRAREALGVK